MRYILPWKARIAILLLLLFAGTSGAQVLSTASSSASSISYQAQITGRDGKPISGEHTVTITIYTDASGTQSIWTSTTKSMIASGGILDASLGTTDNPLPPPSMMDRTLWVGISVDGTPELRPLSMFSAAPVALNVADNAITTPKLSPNAVTADKIGADYVGSISVNGERVTNKGSDLNIVTGEGVRSTYVPSSNTLVLSGDGTSIDGRTMAATGFDEITTQTNTTATMTVGSGASIVLGGGDVEASKVKGSASTTDAVDLATTEVSGILPVTNGGTGGAGVTAGAWLLGGNATTATQTLGTTTTQTMDVDVAGLRIIRYEPSTSALAAPLPNIIGGAAANNVGTVSSSVIAGGGTAANPNTIRSDFGFIGGGTTNLIDGFASSRTIDQPIDFSVIGGGEGNRITASLPGNPTNEGTPWHVIGGGDSNSILIDVNSGTEGWMGASTIAGGQHNVLSGPWGFIGGGLSNIISNRIPTVDDDGGDKMSWNAIAGGQANTIHDSVIHSVIAGGNSNEISGALGIVDAASVAGGSANYSGRSLSAIGGGDQNVALGLASTISGGSLNSVEGDYSAIAGGSENGTLSGANYGFAGAGYGNSVQNASASSVGGAWLTTSGEAQTVLGWLNLPFGNNHLMAAGQNDDRIFEIGSPVKQGINWAPANAFEVSYNGHSIVYHTNGQSLGGSPKVYQGATYVESPVYAWGAIDALGNVIGTSSFGISASVQIMAPGVYMISLAPADPHSGPTPSLADASVTVTVLNNDITDITVAPPEPPGGGLTAPTAAAAPRTVSDSLVRTRFGDAAESAPTLSASSSALSPLLPNICGYATASQIGVLAGTYGSAYANSFIVRTYTYGEQCQRANLPFFFKVCHR